MKKIRKGRTYLIGHGACVCVVFLLSVESLSKDEIDVCNVVWFTFLTFHTTVQPDRIMDGA